MNGMARELISPLRYPGGKGKMAGVFKRIIEENALLDGTYVEPFVGGGSVALSLLLNDYVSRDQRQRPLDICLLAFGAQRCRASLPSYC